jgi:hypothetical protein
MSPLVQHMDRQPPHRCIRCLMRFHLPVGEALGYAQETKAGKH